MTGETEIFPAAASSVRLRRVPWVQRSRSASCRQLARLTSDKFAWQRAVKGSRSRPFFEETSAFLMNPGGNVAVLAGRDGMLMVDAGLAASRVKMMEALVGIGPAGVKHLINTHWHFDHTDGNEWVHAAGAIILAHQNTRKHLAAATRVEFWDFTFPASPAGAIPSVVFTTSHRLRANNTSRS